MMQSIMVSKIVNKVIFNCLFVGPCDVQRAFFTTGNLFHNLLLIYRNDANYFQ